MRQDRRIYWRSVLISLTILPFLVIGPVLSQHGIIPSFFGALALAFAIGISLCRVLECFFVNPLLEVALRQDSESRHAE